MPDESDIRAAEHAKVAAALAKAGTEGERFALTLSALRRRGITLSQLAAAAAGEASLGTLVPDPEEQGRVLARIELRGRLGLPHVDCLRASCSCVSLADVLERCPDASADRIRRLARRLHRLRRPRRTLSPPEPSEKAEDQLAPAFITEAPSREPAQAPGPPPRPLRNVDRPPRRSPEPLDPRSPAAWREDRPQW